MTLALAQAQLASTRKGEPNGPVRALWALPCAKGGWVGDCTGDTLGAVTARMVSRVRSACFAIEVSVTRGWVGGGLLAGRTRSGHGSNGEPCALRTFRK